MELRVAFLAALAVFGLNDVTGQDKVLKCSYENLRCDLPFEYEDKWYDACTTDGLDDGRQWCPTKLYEDGTADLHYCMECWGDQRCYYTGKSFPDTSWIMSCPPGCYHVQKNTYGSDNEFSVESFVCAAAIHEGLIQNNTGGEVILTKQPWSKPYVGNEKNDIVTYPAKMEGVKMMKFRENFQVAPTPHMIFTNEKTLVSSLQSRSVTAVAIATSLVRGGGVAADAKKAKIFWSDLARKSIYSATFNGRRISSERRILQGTKIQSPEMLAVDWIHGNLYWSDKDRHSVSMSDLNGRNMVTLIERSNFEPRGLAVDPKNGYFYIADSGLNPKIEKCVMAEKDSCVTIVQHDIVSPAGLAIDVGRNALCWADNKKPQISCTRLDGTNRRNMKFSKERLKQPFAIALLNGKVYWTDLSATIVASADLNSWHSFHVHLGDINKATGLAFFASQAAYVNKCTNAPCSQICVPTEESYDCLCSDGTFPQGDGTCGSTPLKLEIFVAETSSIKRHTINPETSSRLSTTTIASGLLRATAVAFDTLKKNLYWSDTRKRTIDMVKLSATLSPVGRPSNFIKSDSGYVSTVEGIAIDSITRLFYWTDIALHGVFVTNLDPVEGKHHITRIIDGDSTYKPRGIALDPKHGYIYVVDSAYPFKIQQCESKGRKTCKTLIENGLNRPNWVTIDYTTQRLYFTNTFTTSTSSKISSTDFEGKDRKEIKANDIARPYGIGVHKKKIYWSDHASRSVMSIDEKMSTNSVIRTTSQPMGLILYDPRNPNSDNYPNVCASKDCRYLCVPTPKVGGSSPTCLCPEAEKGKSDPKECACESGYEALQIGNVPCTDIDECTEKHDYGGCGKKQNCQNTIGSYSCNCGRPGQKPCKTPCTDKPCKNGGICKDNEDGEDYSCTCRESFVGKDCEKFEGTLKQITDDETGAITLQCLVPSGVNSEILWLLNRNNIDPADRWLVLEDNGRKLVIQSPHYEHSGVFSCQFTYGDTERIARTTVIVKVKPKFACGQSAGMETQGRKESPKVLGGTKTRIGYAPFVAMLYKKTHSSIKKGVFCGGSLVDTRHVLTAAHCFHQVNYKEVSVYFGKLTTDTNKLEKLQQSSEIAQIIKHPEHHPKTLHADITIIVLKTEIYFTTGVKPICIPTPNDVNEEVKPRPWKNEDTKYGIVYGWGLTDDGHNSDSLMEVILPIVKQGKCKNGFEQGRITDTMFCVGGLEKRDACQGDSGGPFTLWSKKETRWYLGGIVSWGVQCGISRKPGVYVRIGVEMRKWIYDNTDLVED